MHVSVFPTYMYRYNIVHVQCTLHALNNYCVGCCDGFASSTQIGPSKFTLNKSCLREGTDILCMTLRIVIYGGVFMMAVVY